jgi:hypothetical protein
LGSGIPSPSARGRRGTTPQPPPGAERCPAAQRTLSNRLRGCAAFPKGKASDRINYQAPSEKSTTHGEGSDQLPLTEGNSRPRHTGVAEAAGPWRLGPTVYELCSFRLKDSSVTSATEKVRFIGWERYTAPVGSGTTGHDTAAPPGGGTVSRGATNLIGPTAGICGIPTRQGIESDQLTRTGR